MPAYNAKICISTDYGELEDVPAVVDYSAEFIEKFPAAGAFRDEWLVTCEVVSVDLGGVTLDRYQLVALVGETEAQRQEALVAEKIACELETGELEAA